MNTYRQQIIIHPGQAHQDEFLAVALWLGFNPNQEFLVFRRDPLPSELADPNVICIDVGGQYNPPTSNFDHHQDGELPAAFQLVVKHFVLSEVFRSIFSWYDTMSQMDVDLFGVPKRMGISNENFFSLLSPVASFVIAQLEKTPANMPLDAFMMAIMKDLGMALVGQATKVVNRLQLLKESCKCTHLRHGVHALVHGMCREPGLAMSLHRKSLAPTDIGVSITPDDRGEQGSWALYRFEDHPLVNFRVVKDDPGIIFCHANGFIAKTGVMSVEEAVGLAIRSIQ